MATKGDGARDLLGAERSYAICHVRAKGKPRRHVPNRGRTETLCVRTPAEDAPKCLEAPEMSTDETLRS